MGKRSGRLCLTYQIDFSEDILEFSGRAKNDEIYGTIRSENDFYDAISKLLDFYKTDDLSIALKHIKLYKTRLSGVCPKSFLSSQLTIKLIEKLNLCLGGYSGCELVNLPFVGTILDQPNIFIEAYYIWLNEYNSYRNLMEKKQKNEDSGKR